MLSLVDDETDTDEKVNVVGSDTHDLHVALRRWLKRKVARRAK